MAINIKFDAIGNPEPPSIILATKNGNKLGLLNVNADSIELKDKLEISEISFTLNKYIDGKLNNLWDKVVDFKLVWCKEWDVWFEIKVELDEATETVKTVFGTQLGQAELSQIMVYNMEVNTEEDIARDDYKITILYDENDHEASLLHRIFKDKAPHYSIAYVDPAIARIQRQFSWDGSSVCDVLDEIEEEIGCLVVYNSNSTEGGIPNRSISVYDLEQYCNDCGHRGEFTEKCPKCGSKNIKHGYGEDTTIFVTNDELASEGIQLVADTDSVKNCFKLEAGDDLMTATVRNCNPNGSDYIWRFSDDIKEDMSDELVEKLESYDAQYKRYYDGHESNLDTTLLPQYNNLVEKYDDFYNTDSTCLNCDNQGKFYDKCPSCDSENLLTGKELQKISTPIVGYPSLMNAYYNTIDFALYLKSGLMPSIVMSDTTATEQASLLTISSLSPVAVNVKEASSISSTTADSAVLSMAKIIVKSTYKVEILSSALSTEKKWSGTFKITNYSDDTDTAEVVVNDIVVNNDAETFIKQKIEKALNKEDTDDYSISGLFEKEYDEFCTELTKYALKPLQSFYDAADACISILTEQGAGDETNKPDLYKNLYLPYFQKQEAIASEINIRKNELAIIEGVYDEATKTATGGLQNNIRNCQSVIQDALNFEGYLGKDLWKEFCSFRREDKYSNSNYTSDGLNNAQLFQRALEFLDVAENEIYKSSELQHSISTSLNNLLAIDKFKPLVKYFKNGNWIRVRVDDKIYKLRLLEYDINFGSFESISVEFSDVIKIKNGITDVKDIFEQASSVASSYDAVTRQAKKGNVAKGTIEQWMDEGLNAANVQIQNNDSEEIIITKNGLLGRSYDDITGTYSPEQLKITHNIMAYTDDNWETVSSALGKHQYQKWEDNQWITDTDYGLSSKFVTAGYVTGSQIIGGEIISSNYTLKNESEGIEAKGTYIDLINGNFSFAGGKIVYNPSTNKVDLSNVTIQWDSTNPPTIAEAGLEDVMDDIDALNMAINPTQIAGGYVASPLIKGGYLDIKNSTNNTGVIIDPNGYVNEDYIFRVYNGGATAIGLDVDGNAEFSGTINGSHFIGGDLLIGDTTKVGDYAEITNDGALTCTNVNIQGGILQIGSKNNEETHTWISTDGTLNTHNANISGEIRAEKGAIGGFTIEPTEIEEDGSNLGGWLYNGESIGSDKSIFLSATDMSGTVSETTLDDWRLTVGENFGVASDGTAYMSNCEITGGSLRMGTASDEYHTWISSDGVLNASGANIDGTITSIDGDIGGWHITKDGIEKNGVVGMSSGEVTYASLVGKNALSPIRFYAGSQNELSEPIIKTETLSCTSTEETLTQTITLSEQEQEMYKVVGAKCLTTTKLHSGDVLNRMVSVVTGNVPQTTVGGETSYYGSAIYPLLPVWVLEEHITTMYSTNNKVSLTYLGNGQVRVSATSETANVTVEDAVTIAYSFTETLDISTTYNDTTVSVVFNPQTIGVEYNIDIEYILDANNLNFIVLEDGSLYASAANIKGSVEAEDGKIGQLTISEGALKSASATGEGYELTAGGIKFYDDNVSLSFGDSLTITTVSTNSIDLPAVKMEATGALEISGQSTSIQLNTESSDESVVKNFRVYANYYEKSGGLFGNNRFAHIWLIESGESNQLLYDQDITFKWFSYIEGNSAYVASGTANTVWYASSSHSCRQADIQFTNSDGAANIKFVVQTWINNELIAVLSFLTSEHAVGSGAFALSDTVYSFEQKQKSNNIIFTGNLIPSVTAEYNLGRAGNEWHTIFCQTSNIDLSDKNLKNNIQSLNTQYSQLFDSLRPVSYKFNDNQSGRTHIGLIAQDVEDGLAQSGLTSQDFAGLCYWDKGDGTKGYGLRYGEFIALCIDQIQKLKTQVAELKSKLELTE